MKHFYALSSRFNVEDFSLQQSPQKKKFSLKQSLTALSLQMCPNVIDLRSVKLGESNAGISVLDKEKPTLLHEEKNESIFCQKFA